MSKLASFLFFLTVLCGKSFAYEGYLSDYFEVIELEGGTFLVNIPGLPVKDLPLKQLGDIATKNMVLALNKGTVVPLRIAIKGNLFKPEGTSHVGLKLLETLFIKFVEGGVLVSTDAKNWKGFEELIEASVGTKFELDKQQRPSLRIDASVDLKK